MVPKWYYIKSCCYPADLRRIRRAAAASGQVEIRGELWQATLRGAAHLPPGATVIVKEVNGLLLSVEPEKES